MPGFFFKVRTRIKLTRRITESQLNVVTSLLCKPAAASAELEHQCHLQLVFEDPLLPVGNKRCSAAEEGAIAIMILTAFFHVERPSKSPTPLPNAVFAPGRDTL